MSCPRDRDRHNFRSSRTRHREQDRLAHQPMAAGAALSARNWGHNINLKIMISNVVHYTVLQFIGMLKETLVGHEIGSEIISEALETTTGRRKC